MNLSTNYTTVKPKQIKDLGAKTEANTNTNGLFKLTEKNKKDQIIIGQPVMPKIETTEAIKPKNILKEIDNPSPWLL